jgi:hypothetical protein
MLDQGGKGAVLKPLILMSGKECLHLLARFASSEKGSGMHVPERFLNIFVRFSPSRP